jgi:hypothetical protein
VVRRVEGAARRADRQSRRSAPDLAPSSRLAAARSDRRGGESEPRAPRESMGTPTARTSRRRPCATVATLLSTRFAIAQAVSPIAPEPAERVERQSTGRARATAAVIALPPASADHCDSSPAGCRRPLRHV